MLLPEKPFERRLIVLSSLAFLLFAGIGFYIDPRGFLGNILAEIAGVCVGITIGVAIVDRYIQQEKERQWSRVRDLTFKGLWTHLSGLAIQVFLDFSTIQDHRPMGPISEAWKEPDPACIPAFEEIIASLRPFAKRDIGNESSSDVAVRFYNHLEWDLDQIRDILMPRILQYSSDQALINILVEFDDARRDLHHAIIGHKLAGTQEVTPYAIALLEQGKLLYGATAKRWTERGASPP